MKTTDNNNKKETRKNIILDISFGVILAFSIITLSARYGNAQEYNGYEGVRYIREADPETISLKSMLNDPSRLYISTEDYSPEELVRNIFLTGCVEAYNVSYTGSNQSIGYFSDNSGNFNFSSGIILASGNITNAMGPNDNDNETTNLGLGGDPDLNIISGYITYDAAALEFDFIPSSEYVEFRYVFGSEEYPEYACSKFNDVFAFLLSGPGISGGQGFSHDAVNIALLPDEITPVAINNIHNTITAATDITGDGCPAINVEYYIDNGTGNNPGNQILQFDGYTITLVARMHVTPCQTYHIKIVIADASDRILDSGVFLEAKSFSSESIITQNYTPTGPDNNVYENCDNYYEISRSDPSFINNDVTVHFTYSGNVSSGIDYSGLPDSITIPAGNMSAAIHYTVFTDLINEGIESLIISVHSTCPCIQSDIVSSDTIWFHDGLQIQSINAIDIKCNNSMDGSIEISAMNASGQVLYSLNNSPFQLSNVFNNLPPGIYSIEIIDDSQCPVSISDISISEPGVMTSSLSLTNPVLCHDNQNGEITVLATGGTGSLSYSINGGAAQSSNVFSNLSSGAYSILVTDENGCAVSTQVVEIANPEMLTASASASPQVSCYDYSDGELIVSATGGTGSLSYSINGGVTQSSGVFSGLTSGSYNVLVSDENGCYIYTQELQIANPARLTAVASGTQQVSCHNDQDGEITATANGGTGTLTFSLNGGQFQSSGYFSGLASGSYEVIVTDENGCSAILPAINIANPEILTISASGSSQVSCYNSTDGIVEVTAAGGTGVLSYSINGSPSQSDGLFSGLLPGYYTAVVTDENGCVATAGALQIVKPAMIVAQLSGTAQVSCFGSSDGEISINAWGGTGFLEYSLNGGAAQTSSQFGGLPAGSYQVVVTDENGCSYTTSGLQIENPLPVEAVILGSAQVACHDDADGIVSVNAYGGTGSLTYTLNSGISQSSGTFQGLPAGFYQVLVTDENGCNTLTPYWQIANPAQLTAVALGTSQVSCHDASDGTVSVNAYGGTGLLSYSLDGSIQQPSGTFTGLPAGSYQVTVTDENGCLFSTSYVEIGNPEAISVTPVHIANVTCFGDENGSVSFSAQGGTGTLFYSLNDGVATEGQVFQDLPTGYYEVIVTDDYGCTASASAFVYTPAPLTADYNNYCKAGEVGIDINAHGGTAPYLYSIDGGANFSGSGIFETLPLNEVLIVIVKDNNKCSSDPVNVPVESLVSMEASAVVLNGNLCFGAADANVEIIASGGLEPYSYIINNNMVYSESVLSGLQAGEYIVAIRDANECPAEVKFEIFGQDQMNIEIVSLKNADCTGNNPGEAQISVNGGNAPYDIKWSDGSRSAMALNLYPGVHTVTVTDMNNCNAEYSLKIDYDEVTEEPEINNVFSPNGDGINDQWVIKNLQFFPDNELTIINRWGNEVHTVIGYQNDWNGSDLGEGTYFYILKVNLCDEDKTYDGYVTILR
ncbi:MAG: choice-of-anchor L domain-containing protein [Bacteroidota bacterium]